MDIQLILSRTTAPGQHTEEIWQSVCKQNNLELQVHDIDSENARTLIDKVNIKTFPALIVDEKIVAVGNPDQQTANRIFRSLISSLSQN